MTATGIAPVPLQHADRFFIDGEWIGPSSDATFDVVDSSTEQVYFSVPEAQAIDIDRAVSAARVLGDMGMNYPRRPASSPARSIQFSCDSPIKACLPPNGKSPTPLVPPQGMSIV